MFYLHVHFVTLIRCVSNFAVYTIEKVNNTTTATRKRADIVRLFTSAWEWVDHVVSNRLIKASTTYDNKP